MLVIVAIVFSIVNYYQYFDVQKSIEMKVGKVEYANSGTLNGVRYITRNDTVVLELKGTDINYLSNSLTAGGIVVKVGGAVITPTNKTLSGATNITNGVQYILTLSGITGNGELSIEIAANTLKDKSNKQNTQTIFKSGIIVDNTAPTCIITSNPSANPTNASSITYTFTFSENVKSFTTDDITVGSGTKGTFTKVNDKVYTLVVTNSGSCTQTVTLLANKCTDIAGNGNIATTKNVTIDHTLPIISILQNDTIGYSGLRVYVNSSDNNKIKNVKVSRENGNIIYNKDINQQSYAFDFQNKDDGIYTIRITDVAGNASTKNIKIKYLLRHNSENPSSADMVQTTGGWKSNYFKSVYGDIPNVHYQKSAQNGALVIGATPTSGFGRLGTWYTNNEIDMTGYDYLVDQKYTAPETTPTGILQLWAGGNSITKQVSTKLNDGFMYTRLNISAINERRKVITGINGKETDYYSMFISVVYMYKIW